MLAHNRARFAGDGYASADMALWDCGADGGPPRLVAYATQLFLFSFGRLTGGVPRRREAVSLPPLRLSFSHSAAALGHADSPGREDEGHTRHRGQGDDMTVTGLANLAVKVG